MKYQTTAALVSGAICGTMWMPAAKAGFPFRVDARIAFNAFSDTKGTTFRETLDSLLRRHGGDFQDAAFSDDTVIRVERKAFDKNGSYRVHVWERLVKELPDCADLVDADSYVCDFLGED